MKKYVKAGICYYVLAACNGWGAISKSGGEFSPFGLLQGLQHNPDVAISTQGGFAVWQNSSVTSKGERVVINKLNALLKGEGRPIRLTADTERTDETFPRVAMMPNGGAVVVWESGNRNERDVHLRFVNDTGQYLTGVQEVNGFKRGNQTKPDLAVNHHGDVIVTWESKGQDGDGKGVFAQRYTALGIRVGGEITVNQSIKWNQSNPTVAALTDGRFIIVWMSEGDQGITTAGTPHMRGYIMGRIYNRQGDAIGNEFRMDSGRGLCAFPRLIAQEDGGFVAAWTQRDEVVMSNLTDVYLRSFNKEGLPLELSKRHNNYTKEVQENIALANAGSEVLVAWDCGTRDDASYEVHGRLMSGGAEFRVNTKVVHQQRMVVASGDDNDRIIVLWVDVVNSKNTTIKAQMYFTNGEGVDLSAGKSVTKGGIGQPRMPFALKVDDGVITPSGQLEQQRNTQKQEAIVKHESAIQEAAQVARNASAKTAENALKEAAIRMSLRESETASIKSPIAANAPVMQTRQSIVQLNSGAVGASAYGVYGNSNPSRRTARFVPRPIVASAGSARTSAGSARTSTGSARTSTGSARTSTGSARTSTGSARTSAGNSRTSMAAKATLRQSAQVLLATSQHASSVGGSVAKTATSNPSSVISRTAFTKANRMPIYSGASSSRRTVTRVTEPNPSSVISRSSFIKANRAANNSAALTMANRQSAQQAMEEYARRRVVQASSSRFTMQPVIRGNTRGIPMPRGAASRSVSGGIWTASQRAEAMQKVARDRAIQANAMRNVPVPATLDRSSGHLNLQFNSQAGRRYVVQTSSDRTSWRNSGRVQRGTGSPMSVRVDPASSQRYMRVVPTN